MIRVLAFVTGILFVSGCSTANNKVDSTTMQSAIEVAVANPARPDSDRELDDKRKPAEVLSFFEIQPGMHVLDVFGGGGYYTEILSYLVGDRGSVTLYNNNPWDNFVRKQVEERLADNRLGNVSSLIIAPEDLSQDGVGQYDAAIFILGIHDIYYADDASGWPQIDKEKFLRDLYAMLKPGGIFGVIDHNAEPGSDPVIQGKTLHRIDPAIIIRDMEAAGFRLEAESEVLRNPNDDLTGLVFNQELRYQTDRSVLRFTKPD